MYYEHFIFRKKPKNPEEFYYLVKAALDDDQTSFIQQARRLANIVFVTMAVNLGDDPAVIVRLEWETEEARREIDLGKWTAVKWVAQLESGELDYGTTGQRLFEEADHQLGRWEGV